MQGEHLFTDDDAVSQVIGLVMLIAISVVFAAVVAGFLTSVGDTTRETAPRFSIECNTVDGVITHTGGDDVDSSTIELTDPSASLASGVTYTAGEDIVNSTHNSAASGGISPDTRIAWINPEGETSRLVAEC